VVKHMEGEGVDVKKRTEELNAELDEKIEELEDLETLNQNLIVKDRMANDELQDAKKELISVMCCHSLCLENIQIRSLFRCGSLQILSYYTSVSISYRLCKNYWALAATLGLRGWGNLMISRSWRLANKSMELMLK
jgi:hypothetical protein